MTARSADGRKSTTREWAKRVLHPVTEIPSSGAGVDQTSAVLDESARQLSDLTLKVAAALGDANSCKARRLLVPAGFELVDRSVVLERRLSGARGGAQLKVIAACVRFQRPISHETAAERFFKGPTLEAMLERGSGLEPGQIIFSLGFASSSLVLDARLQAWPLLDLGNADAIRDRVTFIVTNWLDPSWAHNRK